MKGAAALTLAGDPRLATDAMIALDNLEFFAAAVSYARSCARMRNSKDAHTRFATLQVRRSR
jgi:hypothetical protein